MSGEIYAVSQAPIPRLALKARDAAKALSISEAQLRRLTKKKRIACVREGRAITWPVAALEDYLSKSMTVVQQPDSCL